MGFLWVLVALLVQFNGASAAELQPVQNPAVFVRGLLDAPPEQDFSRGKLAIDTFVDPSIDADAVLAEIDGMAATIEKMLGTLPPEVASTGVEKFKAIQAYLYRAGHWNDEKPFQYDRSDPYGQNIALALLPNYLASRTGNCVSMPILVLILGERLGLDVTLSTAPLHVFVKFTDDATGQTWNFEATSGGFARDSHMRQEMPMTDQAIANGVYMKTLSRREALAVMASTVMDHLNRTGRHEDAIAVADVLIEAYPTFAYALVKKGTAYHRLLEKIVIRRQGEFGEVPLGRMAEAKELLQANRQAFDTAEALGWREPDLTLSYRPPSVDGETP